MKHYLNHFIKSYIRLIIRQVYLLPIDIYEHLTGRRTDEVPPRRMIFIGQEEYIKQGEKFLNYFRELGGLQPYYAVLDVGCGTGQMAVPLIHFLNEKGTYNGFDVVKSGIDWCNKHISSRHPNFRFQYTEIKNQLPNTLDKANASNFSFPYEDAKFDFVFLTSVFMHLMPTEVEHYINEIARVMKPGATCMMSFFIVNCVSEDLMIKKPTPMKFPFNKGFYRLQSIGTDKNYIAYDEEWLLEKLENAGLKMEIIEYGHWCGRENYFGYEDLLIYSKV